jgi:hypothetical protein
MNDCSYCEYHRKRAQFWRDEAYKQAGHPLPEREWWVWLTDEEITEIRLKTFDAVATNQEVYRAIEAKLKEKNEQTKDT